MGNNEGNNEIKSEDKPNDVLARRELLAKYGQYTAPLVVSMLIPGEAYAHMNAQVYSTLGACASDNIGMPNHNIASAHCMAGGMMGGANAHTVIDQL